MSVSTSLHRFRIDLSDVDRGVYESLDFRLAKHPSETTTYLYTRAIAYALNLQEGLEFSREGLADPDSPAIAMLSSHGSYELWIEIGNPSARRLHKASKASEQVKVYTYKDPKLMFAQKEFQDVHRLDEIEVYFLRPEFLEQLGEAGKEVRWSLLHNDHTLTISVGEKSVQTDLSRWQA